MTYYKRRHEGSQPGPYSHVEWSKIASGISKKAYHKQAKAVRASDGKGTVVGGRTLAYQADPEWEPNQTWF